jgi:hypothetical protein
MLPVAWSVEVVAGPIVVQHNPFGRPKAGELSEREHCELVARTGKSCGGTGEEVVRLLVQANPGPNVYRKNLGDRQI